jgi:hypothetical protein
MVEIHQPPNVKVIDEIWVGMSEAWLGDERGRDDRSCKPATLWARKRWTHLATVFGVVLNWRAAAAFDESPSITLRAIASRP